MMHRFASAARTAAPAVQQVRCAGGYTLFMKQVHRTNKYPLVKETIKALTSSQVTFTKSASAMAAAWKALPKAEKAALNKEAAKIKFNTHDSKKAKYFRKMQNSPHVKGLKGEAKQAKLAKMWAKSRKVTSTELPRSFQKKKK